MNAPALYTAILLVAVSASGVSVWKVQDWRYGARISATSQAAAEALGKETAKVRAAEQGLADRKHEQELTDDAHQKTTADLSARLRTATAATGRLRDPHAGTCAAVPPDATAPASAGAANNAETPGLLSASLTELLLRLTREADDINDAYASCRADGESVRR